MRQVSRWIGLALLLGLLVACSGPSGQVKNKIASAVSTCATLPGGDIDLTCLNGSATVGVATLKQSNFDSSTGTGVFESFVRIQKDGTEKGHNTLESNAINNEKNSGNFTHNLKLSDVPVIQSGGVDYREFRLDINQTNGNPKLSMDELKVSVSSLPDLYSSNGDNYSNTTTKIYDLDDGGDKTVLLNYSLAPGSGNGDMVLLIPDSAFNCADPTLCYVYLWSAFGNKGGDYASNDGFEEWSVRKLGGVFISKSATGTFKRTYSWEIKKSVTPDTWNLFTGDSGTSAYKVEVKRTVTDSDFVVKGTIAVSNNSTEDVFVNQPTDLLPGATNIVVDNCKLSDGTSVTNFPTKLNRIKTTGKNTIPGDTLTCSYTANMPDSTDPTAKFTNTANVGFGDKANNITLEAKTSLDFTFEAPTEVGYSSINVDDKDDKGNTTSWAFSDSGSQSYTRKFSCDADKGDHKNTATIRETSQAASATVTVNCYSPNVSKDASASYKRDWTWSIKKTETSNTTSLILSTGQSWLLSYKIEVGSTSKDSAFEVKGNITVSNPAPMDATINSVTDVLSDSTAATVDCGVTFPYTLAAKSDLKCTYTAKPSDASSTENKATATLQNYDYDKDKVAKAGGTTDFTGKTSVSFSKIETDECISIADTFPEFASKYPGAAATVCASQTPYSTSFTYDKTIKFDTCGTYTVENTASFETNDTKTTGSSKWSIEVKLDCTLGCTLTQGYWKTHSKYGPVPAKRQDDTWNLLPGGKGPDTIFYFSNTTWINLFKTAPKGNPYIILADQYMAATLNILNGASMPASVKTAYDAATTFFNNSANTPTTNYSNTVKNQLTSLASILDQYNNGLAAGGPPHCSEQNL